MKEEDNGPLFYIDPEKDSYPYFHDITVEPFYGAARSSPAPLHLKTISGWVEEHIRHPLAQLCRVGRGHRRPSRPRCPHPRRSIKRSSNARRVRRKCTTLTSSCWLTVQELQAQLGRSSFHCFARASHRVLGVGVGLPRRPL